MIVKKINNIKEGEKVKEEMIKVIYKKDVDIYTEEGKLLARFRKKEIPKENIKLFYENIKDHAYKKTSNRGTASGQKSTKKNVRENPKIMSNVIGYIDGFAPSQKVKIKRNNLDVKTNIRPCIFNLNEKEKWKQVQPYIKEVDKLYKKYMKEEYKNQREKADESKYKIENTSFTTVTTNVNYQTRIHKDRGDDTEGYGNITVIEDGEYTGGETCFPEYGIGFDVREGDILLMDVHEYHGNLKKKGKGNRMSVVCYLKLNVWEKSKRLTKKEMIEHTELMKKLAT